MDATKQMSLSKVNKARDELLSCLQLKEPTFTVIEELLQNNRLACLDFIFLDFAAAAEAKTEAQLWDLHTKVNQRFRILLARFREGTEKKKVVERRKMGKHYLDFIKASMRFYRGYIQRLASHFSGVQQIPEVAKKMRLDTLAVDAPEAVDDKLQEQLLEACYQSLIRLGDLSRYRETELVAKDRNWGPAKGYYELAATLSPGSEKAYNSLAVLTLAEEDHLRTLYYLYRAVSVPEKSELGPQNLALECKKILERAAKGTLTSSTKDDPTLSAAQAKFLVFHASFYREQKLSFYDDYKVDSANELTNSWLKGPLDGGLNKTCLINIAAEAHTRKPWRDALIAEDSRRAERFARINQHLQGLNIEAFSTLLRVFIAELSTATAGRATAEAGQFASGDLLTLVARRILPALRNYSTWLLGEAPFLLLQEQEQLVLRIESFWELYAQALSLLVSHFEVQTIANVTYLLEEDEDTLGFAPFMNAIMKDRHISPIGTIKRSFSASEVDRRSPSDEMLYRVKCLVADGVKIVKKLGGGRDGKRVPIIYAQRRFIYQNDEVPNQTLQDHESANKHERTAPEVDRGSKQVPERTKPNGIIQSPRPDRESDSDMTDSSSNMRETMRSMVDGLVESGTSSASEAEQYDELGPQTPTLRTISGHPTQQNLTSNTTTINAQDLVRQMQRSPTGASSTNREHSLPAPLTSIWTPRPGETTSRPSTSHRSSQTPTSSAHPALANSSAGHFQEAIAQQQRELQMRSSPQQSFDSSWTPYQTPGIRSIGHGGLSIGYGPEMQPPPSPWASSSPARFDSSAGGFDEEHRTPQRALFGAIGEALPRSSGSGQGRGRTPTSAQPD